MKMVLSYFVLLAVSFFAVPPPLTTVVTYAYTSSTWIYPTTQSSPTKASGYLVGKWEEWYEANDFNRDGVLSLDDLKLFEQFYAKIDFFDDEKRNVTVATIDRLWRSALLGGQSELSKDAFVEMLTTSYESNKTIFIQKMEESDREFLKVIDLDGDNFLSKEEYMMDLLASNHYNTLMDDEFFNSHKLVNGLIPIEEAVKVWLRFQIENDPSGEDILEAALQSGL